MGDEGSEGRSFLIDVSDISLRQIETLDETVIGGVLRQLLGDAVGSQSAVAGFDSFVDPGQAPPH
ncbi:FxSxx-COOH cyclophane-containing RiPP peptide [Actinomadura algeriensis]|uniref:FXSXX-COOH protein n=1 Tax=Actinomadura algeriensis TaxID=1679523 RepID=A0ABR9JVC1_9ACTN|nr:FxSxx-COOH cyclophane-containing RiPP peptide [Actinomadura algeriensis]MBE1534348.1 FXSXX-COOH protein [Actinomadura algeriensis]